MISIWHWHTEPALIAGILLVVWAYALLVGPLRTWLDPEALLPRRPIGYFALAVLSFYLAVGSPLDALGENYLFSAHMFQHLVLMYFTAAFTILALPEWLVDGLLERLRLVRLWRFLCHPLVAGILFTLVFSGWHVPTLYEAALHDKAIHMVEHLTMYGSSVLMIWPLLSSSHLVPRSPYGTQIIYLFLLMVAQIPLFAMLTFAENIYYPTYELAPRLPFFPIEPLADQVLGGLIMKTANIGFSLGFMAWAFLMWNRSSEPRRNFRRELYAAGPYWGSGI